MLTDAIDFVDLFLANGTVIDHQHVDLETQNVIAIFNQPLTTLF